MQLMNTHRLTCLIAGGRARRATAPVRRLICASHAPSASKSVTALTPGSQLPWGAALLAVTSAAALCLSPISPAMAEHTSPLDLQDGMMDMEQAAMLIEPRAVTQLLDMLDDDRSSPEELTTAREAAGFRRGTDGRVALHADGGHWFSIKPDSQAAGYMLLRDEADGFCFYLPADPTGRLQQIDLSSDAVVAQLYGNAAWQDVLQPLQTEDSSRGEVVPLRMDARAFRSTEAMLDGAEDSPLAEGWAKVAARGW